MDRRFLAILAAIVIIFIGIFSVTQKSNKTGSSSGNNSNSTVQPSNHVEGNGTKGVTLVEYGDYQCPICELYYPVVKEVAAKYNEQIYLQFRNLPLTQVHPNAFAGARAAEAAAMQGKFWEMHDTLYENTNWQLWTNAKSPISDFNSFAKEVGLDLTKFQQDYSSEKVNDIINADLNAFSKTGQSMATPTFFLDGKYIDNGLLVDNNGPSLAQFSKVIDAEIAKKNPSK
jgi:protein-disulfide isomerase